MKMIRRMLHWALVFALIGEGRSVQADQINMEGCGRSVNIFKGDRIVGGRNALEGEYPWQLAFEMRAVPFFSEYQFICGASLINSKWALTAAHCIAGGIFSSYRIAVGAMNVSSRSTSRVSYHTVRMPIVHEGYNPLTSLSNDIALLRISPVDMSGAEGYVNGVCLPGNYSKYTGTLHGMATVSGWGTTSEGGSLSSPLQSTDVPIISIQNCREAYGNDIDDNMLCAGYYDEGGRDSCQGDSGGPLIQRSEDGTATQIGVVSWGHGCARPKKPGVYTNIANFMPWIQRTMQNFS